MILEHLYFPPTEPPAQDEPIRFHICLFDLDCWAEWWLFGKPFDIVGHGSLSGHIWRMNFGRRRIQKVTEELIASAEIVRPMACRECRDAARNLCEMCDHVDQPQSQPQPEN